MTRDDVNHLSDSEITSLTKMCEMIVDVRPPYDPVYEAAAAFLSMMGAGVSDQAAGICAPTSESSASDCAIPTGFTELDIRDASYENLQHQMAHIDQEYRGDADDEWFSNEDELMSAGQMVAKELKRRQQGPVNSQQEFDVRIRELQAKINGLQTKVARQRTRFVSGTD